MGLTVSWKGLEVPLVRIEEIGVGELKDMIQEWIDWENQHNREVPRFLRSHWPRRITFIATTSEITACRIRKAEGIARPSEVASNSPSSKEYSGEERGTDEANPRKKNIGVQ